MLDIAVLFLVKLSALSFIKYLTAVRLHGQLVTVLEAVILGCSLPNYPLHFSVVCRHRGTTFTTPASITD